ncbi:hypothetical protein [Mangrovicoccus ximenensis]|uniref:hypothetical protein n=1 Tax=Mangrovicoccus ximenensis TaxID=1911570 RepID=UPI001F285FFD|nr:hypothetical protein [Mangrovicoccus ximenensis]
MSFWEGISPHLAACLPLSEAIPGLPERVLLHAGPAFSSPAACPRPVRNAAAAAALAEGWAAADPGTDPAPAPVAGIEITGTGQDDTLAGTGGDDTLTGGDGNDILIGNGGNDVYRFSLPGITGGGGSAALPQSGNFFADPAAAYLNFGLGSGYDPLARIYGLAEGQTQQAVNVGSTASTILIDDRIEELKISGYLTSLTDMAEGSFLMQSLGENIRDKYGIHVAAHADLASAESDKGLTLALRDGAGGLSFEMKVLLSIAAGGGASGSAADYGLRLGGFDMTGDGMLEVLADGRGQTDILRFEGEIAKLAFDHVRIANTGADTTFAEYQAQLDHLGSLIQDFRASTLTDPFRNAVTVARDYFSMSLLDAGRSYEIDETVTWFRIGGTLYDATDTTSETAFANLGARAAIEGGFGLHVAAMTVPGDTSGSARELTIYDADGNLSAEFKALLTIADAGGAVGSATDLNLRLGAWSASDSTLDLYVDGTIATDLITLKGGLAAAALAYLNSASNDLDVLFPAAVAPGAVLLYGDALKYKNFDLGEGYDPTQRLYEAVRPQQTLALGNQASTVIVDDSVTKIRLTGRLTDTNDAEGFASKTLAENIAEGYGIHVAAMADMENGARDKTRAIRIHEADGSLTKEMQALLSIAARGGEIGTAQDIGIRLGDSDPAAGWMEILVDGVGQTDVIRLDGAIAGEAAQYLAGDTGAVLDQLQAEYDALAAKFQGFIPSTLYDPFRFRHVITREKFAFAVTDAARTYAFDETVQTISIRGRLTDIFDTSEGGFRAQSLQENIEDGWGIHAVAALLDPVASNRENSEIDIWDDAGGLTVEMKGLLAIAAAGGMNGAWNDYGLRLEIPADDPGVLLVYVDGTRATDILKMTGALAAAALDFVNSAECSVEALFGFALSGEPADDGISADPTPEELLGAANGTNVTGLESGFGRDEIRGFDLGDRIEVATAEGQATPLEIIHSGRDTILKFGTARNSEITIKGYSLDPSEISWDGTIFVITATQTANASFAKAKQLQSGTADADVFDFAAGPEGFGRQHLNHLAGGDQVEVAASLEDFLGLRVADGNSILRFADAGGGWKSEVVLWNTEISAEQLSWAEDHLTVLV